MYKFIMLSFIAAASCGTPKTTNENTSIENIETSTIVQEETNTLLLGEETVLGGVRVHFKEVLGDSRCPTGTTCFWQGRAILLVETSENGMIAERNEIIFGEVKNGETKNHAFYKNGNTTITATAINPYPTKDSGTTNLEYELVLVVSN
jgi:hypothetical protein